MRITPLDIRKQEFRRSMRGLDPEEVHAFLTTIADEYEAVLNDNKALKERLLELDDKVQEYRNMEKTLRNTLLTAERVNVEAKENARREAGIIIKEAEIEAEKAFRNIRNEAMELRNSIQDLKRQKENYISRIKIQAESHLKFIESVEKDFEQEDKTIDAMAPPEIAKPFKDEEVKPSGPAAEMDAIEDAIETLADKDEPLQESRFEKSGTLVNDEQEEKAQQPKSAPPEAIRDKSAMEEVPNLDEILDKMAKSQRETFKPEKRPQPASPAGLSPPPSQAAAPSKSRTDTSPPTQTTLPPEPAAGDSLPDKQPKKKQKKDKADESTGVRVVSQEQKDADQDGGSEEWSLEKLKRDILSGGSGGNEKG